MNKQNDPTQATANTNTKTPKIEPYYNYNPLREGWIRLLRIHVTPPRDRYSINDDLEKETHVDIEEHSLQSCPTYIALSYTWGDATVITDPTTSTFTKEPRCFPVYCEGRLLRGTRNLRDALRRLRQGITTRRYTIYKQTGIEKDALGDTDLYWIDALCVDQDDLAERSTQVVLMSKIYGQARSCLVYLGERDETSKLALEVVGNFAQDKDLNDQMRARNPGKVRDLVVRKMEVLAADQKSALSVLLARRWFSRVWVLQEVVLSSKVIGLLGSLVFDFSALFFLGQLVSFAKTDLAVLALDDFKIGPQRFTGDKDDDPRPHQAAVNLGVVGGSRVSLQRGEVPGFLEVILMSFVCQTTDQRDRIYAILAISAELQREGKPTVPVNYHLSVDRVYADATVAFSLRRNDLEFLSLVGEHKFMKIKSLPSWCPDYSTRHFWIRNLGDASGWHIGRFWRSPPKIDFQDSRCLVVSGVRWDTLAGVATTGVFDSSEIIQCARPSELLELVLNLRRGPSQRAFPGSTTPRVDILWRLLFMDEFMNQRPAPPVTALFLPHVIVHMFQFYWDRKSFGISGGIAPNSPAILEEISKVHQIIEQIWAEEPQSIPFLPDISAFWQHLAALKVPEVHVSLIANIMDRATKAGLLSDVNALMPSSAANAAPTEDNAEEWGLLLRREVFPKMAARLFKQSYFSTTHTGQLGIGYSSMQKGDELWLLNGHSAPVVLRRLHDGKYRFLGETFVQGMMFGELAGEIQAMNMPVGRIEIE